jgi:putative transposase
MPAGLKRYQEAHDGRFITFSCADRAPLIGSPALRDLFLEILERVRGRCEMRVYGYVVMPEHVHMLVSEPERMSLASAIQLLKQNVSRLSHPSKIGQGGAPTHPSKISQGGAPQPFWLPRYFDLNVWTEKKLIEKLRYMHRNPVKRGLVERPEDWEWSSFRHYLLGEVGPVEIESQWTARKRWMSGLEDPTVKKPK